MGQLTFHEPDLERFRCLKLAYQALSAGGTAPAVLNAANEIAVDAFLEGKIEFLAIANLIEEVLSCNDIQPLTSLEQVLAADTWSREMAHRVITSQKMECDQ